MQKKKKCPRCNSTRITYNEKGELHCKKCDFVNSREKPSKWITFDK